MMMMLRSIACLIFLLQTPSLAHESACHVCIGVDHVASVATPACQLLVFAADNLADGSGDECRGIQYQGVTEGCCDTPTNFCNLCEQGGNLPDPDQLASMLTCAEVGGLASFLPSNDVECVDYQATYGVYCGCDNPIAINTAKCSLCENKGPILHRKVVPAPQFQSDANAPANRFCGVLEYFAQFSTAPLATCEAYQDAFADDCCRPMTDSPIVAPTEQVVPPTNAPIVAPTDAPIVAPTDAPVTSTNAAPVDTPTDAPVTSTAPVTGQPVMVQVADPTAAPVDTETVEVGDRSFAPRRFPIAEVVAIICLVIAIVN